MSNIIGVQLKTKKIISHHNYSLQSYHNQSPPTHHHLKHIRQIALQQLATIKTELLILLWGFLCLRVLFFVIMRAFILFFLTPECLIHTSVALFPRGNWIRVRMLFFVLASAFFLDTFDTWLEGLLGFLVAWGQL